MEGEHPERDSLPDTVPRRPRAGGPGPDDETVLHGGDDAPDETLVMDTDGTASRPAPEPVHVPSDEEEVFHEAAVGHRRYRDITSIGTGGVGLVYRADDPVLGRVVAIKELRPRYCRDPELRLRFLREARVMGALEHPNIVPIHELGRREDGALYFAMKRVHGTDLKTVLNQLSDGDRKAARQYTLNTLLDMFLDVCQAVAFAHSRRVIHRDIKPANVLLGPFGEVLLLDWGLAKTLVAPGAGDSRGPVIETSEGTQMDIDGNTLEGAVSGTPRYMAPEQAMGKASLQDERTDIYALGVLLYEILTLRNPHRGNTVNDVLKDVVNGRIEPPTRTHRRRHVPRELSDICMKALSKRRRHRYARVLDLVADIDLYRNGFPVDVSPDPPLVEFWKLCRRHRVVSASAAILLAGILLLSGFRESFRRITLASATRFHNRGVEKFDQRVETFAELERVRRRRVSKKTDEREAQLAAAVETLGREVRSEFDLALMLFLQAYAVPSKALQNSSVRGIFERRIRYSLLSRDYQATEQISHAISQMASGDQQHQARIQRFQEWVADVVRGDGTLTIHTRRPAAVSLQPFVEQDDGRLIPGAALSLGRTPIRAHALAKGSYLVTLRQAEAAPVRCPFLVDHGEDEVIRVRIPASVPAGTVFVPGGETYLGGEESPHYRSHERVVPGFFMQRHEVTFGEYIEYWLDPDGGNRDLELSALVRLDARIRCYRDAWDDDGVLSAPFWAEMPVVGVPRAGVEGYCAWLGKRMGRPCRLPTAEEWEKAARGADGRLYPWGSGPAPELAFTWDNTAAREQYEFWAPGGAFPGDRSVYGVMDLAGNVREMTSSTFVGQDNFHQIKGASAVTSLRYARADAASDTAVTPTDVGFRCVFPLQVSDIAD